MLGDEVRALAGKLAAGDAHSCVVAPDTRILCWGAPSRSGTGGTGIVAEHRYVLNLDGYTPLQGVSRVESNWGNTCALMLNGTLNCWGSSNGGQLTRDGGEVSEPLPVLIFDESGVGPLSGVTAVGIGAVHACAVKHGAVLCWGNVLTNPKQMQPYNTLLPTPVQGLSGTFVDVAAALNYTCAVRDDGTVWCWGQRGNGYTSTDPVQAQISEVVDIDAGISDMCALTNTGEVFCWGANYAGINPSVQPPVQVMDVNSADPIIGAKVVSVGGSIYSGSSHSHACVVRSDSQLACWGNNYNGQLANGNRRDSVYRTAVMATNVPGPVVSAVAGGRHTCALLDDGRVGCAGYNNYFQLGTGVMSGGNPTPGQSSELLF